LRITSTAIARVRRRCDLSRRRISVIEEDWGAVAALAEFADAVVPPPIA
jgi:hypothetical protein